MNDHDYDGMGEILPNIWHIYVVNLLHNVWQLVRNFLLDNIQDQAFRQL